MERLVKWLCALGITLSANAFAQIPVTDIAQITTHVNNQVESMMKWTMQAQQMVTQIQQYQQHIQMLQGTRNLGDLMNNPLVQSNLPPDFNTLVQNAKSLPSFVTERGKYPTLSNMPKTNALFDTIAAQSATMNDLFSKSSARMQQVQNLMGQINTAVDPTARSELANRLINESNSIQANATQIQILQQMQKAELDAAHAAAIKEFTCQEFKRSS